MTDEEAKNHEKRCDRLQKEIWNAQDEATIAKEDLKNIKDMLQSTVDALKLVLPHVVCTTKSSEYCKSIAKETLKEAETLLR